MRKGGIRQRGYRLLRSRNRGFGRLALYRAVTASSSVSCTCSWTNSSAKPSSRFRTTRDCTLPSITSDFSGGGVFAANPAPHNERAPIRQGILLPPSPVSSALGVGGSVRVGRRAYRAVGGV